jgi:Uncharacterized protein involved in exopolysaccharide biosynthesis
MPTKETLEPRFRGLFESKSLEREISLLDDLKSLRSHKRQIALVVFGCMVLSSVVAFLIPPTYTAEAIIVPPHESQSASSSLMGQLGGLATLGLTSFAWRNPADQYIGILKSRTIADAIITKFKLKEAYNVSRLSAARKRLEDRTTLKSGADLLIHIKVEDGDPERAAGIANAYVEQLHAQNARLALTDSAQRRLFFQEQLEKEKVSLADAEVALKDAEHTTGLVVPAGQAEALIRSSAQLRAQIASREVLLNGMRSFATEQHPQVQLLQREIAALRTELARIEAKEGKSRGIALSAGSLPEATLTYVRALRDVKYHEALYEFLAKQFEAANIDEARSAPLIQVVDSAVRPDRRSAPHRSWIVLGAGIAAAFLSCAYVLMKDRTTLNHARREIRDDDAQL